MRTKVTILFILSLLFSSYGDVPFIGEESFIRDGQQLTYVGTRSGESYFSSDSQLMIFQSEREAENPFYQIYLMDLETGDTTHVSPGIGKTTCAWIHPNKEKVLYASTHLDPLAVEKQEEEWERRASGEPRRYQWDFDETYELFEANTQGDNLVNLTNALGYDAEASWSPNGSKIVFASNRAGYTGELSPEDQAIFDKDPSYMMDIYIMDSDGSNLKQLTTNKGYDGGPFFSPDGNRIVWRAFDENGMVAEVFTMNIDGSDKRQITKLGFMSWAPFYHPSGDYIIFASNVHGHRNFELFIVDALGEQEPVRVTYTEGFDGLPVFLPNGKQLAWTTTRGDGDGAQVFIGDWDDRTARYLLDLPDALPGIDQTSIEILEDDVKLHVEYLASDALEGRLTGEKGELLATAHVARVYDHLGLVPIEGRDNFFHEFEFLAGVSIGETNALTIYEHEQPVDEMWRPLAFSADGSFENEEVVFAGYGLVAPESEEFPAYNSYVHLDVKDKWVMMFRYVPEGIDRQYRQHLSRYGEIRRKAMEARQLGAKGIIVVSGPNSNVNEELIPLRFDASSAGMSLKAITVTDQIGNELLRDSDHTLKTLQDTLDKGDMVSGFVLKTKVSGTIELVKEKKKGRNVVGMIPVEGATESILVGAHVDHLGKDGEDIYNGADDNASGVSGILELAEFFAKKSSRQEKRNLIFAAWSGEELGLLGSAAFVKDFVETKDLDVVAAINLDMIGRLDEHVVVQGVGSSSRWPKLIEKFGRLTNFAMVSSVDPYLPTDSTSFYLKGVPTLSLFTGSHEDYHKPTDTSEKINYQGIVEITELVRLVMKDVATSDDKPDYIEVDPPNSGTGQIRVYLGTIPDYTNTAVVGVLLTGVKPNSPAAKAGLQSGDIIVKLAGQNIENIYDYTYILSGLRVGEEVEIIVKRSEAELTFPIVPASRS